MRALERLCSFEVCLDIEYLVRRETCPLKTSVSKGAYHLLELSGTKELVLIRVNEKVKAGNKPSDPCLEYTQELL